MRKRTPVAVIGVLVLFGTALGTVADDDQPTPTPAPSATTTAPKPAPPSSLPTYATKAPTPAATGPAPATAMRGTVDRVIDGDTLEVIVGGDELDVRVIGIDTPETKHPRKPVQCYGPEASAEAERLLAGQAVTLIPDPSQGRTDNYGRTLAYVEVNGLDLGAHMIEAGYAREATYDGRYERQTAYRAAEDLARSAGAGQWSAC